jgi:CCR4-NOT transcription complex subunit 2
MQRPGEQRTHAALFAPLIAQFCFRSIIPGQPQQRAPSLAAQPGLASQFRPQYPSYGMPPRNVLQATGGYVPSLQPNTHRTATQQSQVQTITSQPASNFLQARGQSSYGFGGALSQHQQSSALQQQLSSQQQQQTNGTSSSMPPHIAQPSGLGTPPSVSSTSEVGLDPNDFPALGSTPTNNATTSSNNGTVAGPTTSYASQAGTGVLLGGTGVGTGVGTIGGGSGSVTQARDFTPDDFPALGGQSQTSQSQNSLQSQLSSQDNPSHPPGLNGFQSSDQHRQNPLSALGGTLQPGTPGLLNLGTTQTRNVHPGFQQQSQTEAEKQQQRVSSFGFFLTAPATCVKPRATLILPLMLV